MIVLSLFDGMSCGQIALKELKVPVKKYYSSEIDKFAIAQTQLNFPNTIQLGSITEWKTWNIDWSKINLVLAGSPCQGFSFAGKQLNFNDERSKLFFVFVDILNHIKKFNPDVKFLLENVIMKKEYQKVINDTLGLFPVRINSNLVSAQNRNRLYWSNIKIKMVGLFNEIHTDTEQPKDRKILLKDILQPESEIDEKYYIKISKHFLKSKLSKEHLIKLENNNVFTVDTKNRFVNGIKKKPESIINTDKSSCITRTKISTVFFKGLDINKKAPTQRSSTGRCLDKKHNYQIIQLPHGFNKGGTFKEKSPTLLSNSWEHNNHISDGYKLRRLTPLECARLQTIPSWYKWECSDTQQYKMLGNGWAIEVIKHILLQLPPFNK